MPSLKFLCALLLALSGSLHAPPAVAAGFAAAASPSRFELTARAGEIVSRSLEIQHVGAESVEYLFRTADWDLTEAQGLQFFDALRPGSCRPWVRIERRSVMLKPRSRRKLRFEVHVPADAPRGECRFALLVESYDHGAIPLIKDSPISLPLAGRLGVIVYLSIGGAQPELKLVGVARGMDGGSPVPMVVVRNDGDAHGRLEGVLSGTDAAGQSVLLPVATLPVLPGQQRGLALLPAEDLRRKKRAALNWPIELKGRLDWDAGHFDLDTRLE